MSIPPEVNLATRSIGSANSLLIRNAEINGRTGLDVRCQDGVIQSVTTGLSPLDNEQLIDAGGGALIPGLHDHHLHLLSLAKQRQSVDCSPSATTDAVGLRRVLRSAPGSAWIRGTGYHESIAGLPDRHQLDAMVADRPLRIQHRSGKLWLLNSKALDMLNFEDILDDRGFERDSQGRPTGHLFRLDAWLRDALGDTEMPDVSSISALLASFGVTGVTDATPGNARAIAEVLQTLADDGDLRQRIMLMGEISVSDQPSPAAQYRDIKTGPLKIMLDEYRLPDLDWLSDFIRGCHATGRPVAIHCVSLTELVFALIALDQAGRLNGDRIEHASITPDDAMELLSELNLRVVTQPNFIHERGDAYLADHKASDLPNLYRARSFLDKGVRLAGSTDAPFGDPDPWIAMRSAVHRVTAEGRELGASERLTPEEALALFTSNAEDPGGPARALSPGQPADFVLLRQSWRAAREILSSSLVSATVCNGRLTYLS